jgi:hypothetical protein
VECDPAFFNEQEIRAAASGGRAPPLRKMQPKNEHLASIAPQAGFFRCERLES